MRSPAEMDIIQVDITNRCHLNCSNCTRLIAHQVDRWEMGVKQFEQAVASMDGWGGDGKVLGVIGGEPTLHSDFEAIARAFAEIWGGGLLGNGLGAIEQGLFDEFAKERLMDRGPGRGELGLGPREGARGLWTSLGPGFYRNYEVIMEVFHHWNTNTHESGGLHQALLVGRDEYCRKTGMSGEEWERNRDKCWVQEKWSATVNDKGAYFCEVAAGIDRLFYGGMHAWPVEDGWWRRGVGDFEGQLKLCEHCALAQPGIGFVDSDEQDIVGEKELVQLEIIGAPSLKKERTWQFDPHPGSEADRVIETKDNYVGDGGEDGAEAGRRVGSKHRSMLPRKLSLVTVCVGLDYWRRLKVTLERNRLHFDQVVIVTSPNVLEDTLPGGGNVEHILANPHAGNAAFNKAHLLNAGLRALTNPDWIVLADCDVILADDLGEWVRSHALNPGCLHFSDRYDVTIDDLDGENGGEGQVHGQLSCEPNGYFQLFNPMAKAVRQRWRELREEGGEFMPETFCSAGGVDSWFHQQWPDGKKVWAPLPVRHILGDGEAGRELGSGWNGGQSVQSVGVADRPLWRQVGLASARGFKLLPGAPGLKQVRQMRLRFTETLTGRQIEWEPGEEWPVREGAGGWTELAGQMIADCHVHVAGLY